MRTKILGCMQLAFLVKAETWKRTSSRRAVASKAALLLATVVMMLLCGPLSAQIRTGTITGQVSDSSGAVVPNAQVKVTEVDTNVTRELMTDSAGLYDAPNLLPGRYSVAVSVVGFQSESKVGLVLSLGQTLTLRFVLRPGTQKEMVEVIGVAQQLVDSTTSTLGQVITEKPVQDLPLNGRNFTNLLPITAGVMPPPQGDNRFYVNGARGAGTAFLIDGVDVTSPSNDLPRVLPNLEAIGEFKITTNNFNAEYGRALGGIVNAHIRSGTNLWHGSVFEYFRNTVLDSRGYFDKERLPYNFNQFGGSLGGPILKDKLFVFGDYQGVRSVSSVTQFTNVPTLAEDRGDFSDLLPGTIIYDPTTFPRVPFPNNVIPPDRLDPASALMFSTLPPPNATSTATSPFNFIAANGSSTVTDAMDLRVDYNLSSKDRLSGVVIYSNSGGKLNSPFLGPRANGNLIGGAGFPVKARNYSLSYTRVISNTVVNDLNAAWSRDILAGEVQPGQQFEPDLGIPGLNTSPTDRLLTGFPIFLFGQGGYNLFGGSAGTPSSQHHNVPQFSDNLSFVKGRHSFKTGFSAEFRQYNLNQSRTPRGLYVFIGFPTASFPNNALTGGNAAASALLGYPFQINRQILPPFGERIKEYGAYFQDNFKATKRLTLNLGVRWDLYRPSTEQSNRIGDFDPSTVTVVLANENGRSASTLDTNYRDFSPHVGFAYQATADGKTVVRGGFAIGYLNLVTQDVGTVTDRLPENPPLPLSATAFNSPLGPLPGAPVPRVSDGFPLSPVDPKNLCCSANLIYVPQSQPTPQMQQWNLDIQRAITSNLFLDVAYVGTHGSNLTGNSNINQAPPGPTAAAGREPISSVIGTVDALQNKQTSIYHSLQVKVERRFSTGFYLLGSYVFSKSIDELSESSGAGANPVASSFQPQDSRNFGAERGLSDFDARHRVVVSYTYELPFGKGKKFLTTSGRVVDGFLGGWQINGITSAQSGSPFTPQLSNGSAAINSGPGGTVRPYLVGDPSLSSGQSISHWFNVAAFATPGQSGTPAFTFGNAGRNILRGPSFVNFDFSLFKSFALSDRMKLQFRSEFFNVFNHPNFGIPNHSVDLPQAGIITTASPPRLIQFALKLLF